MTSIKVVDDTFSGATYIHILFLGEIRVFKMYIENTVFTTLSIARTGLRLYLLFVLTLIQTKRFYIIMKNKIK